MPGFFTYFHRPLFFGGIALILWVCALPAIQIDAWSIGLLLLIASVMVWALVHYHNPEIEGTHATESRGSAPLAILARRSGVTIGVACSSQKLAALTPVLGKEFNSITPEYEMKWAHLLRDGRLGDYRFDVADRLVDHALSMGVRVRGHNLVWGRADVPASLRARVSSSANPEGAMRELLHEHITSVVAHFKGRIHEWDVVNEPLDGRRGHLDRSIFLEYLGEHYIDDAFRFAHEAAPEAHLFMNEQLWDYNGPRARELVSLANRLQLRHVPIRGIGLQAHVNVPPVPRPAQLKGYMESLATLGLEVHITEFDAVLRLFQATGDPLVAQGAYFREITRACLSVPACTGITFWGASDLGNWYSQAPLFRRFGPHAPNMFDTQMRPKPAYWGVHDALEEHLHHLGGDLHGSD